MAKQKDWKQPFSESETREDALIRMYTSKESGSPDSLQYIANVFGVSLMAVNKKLGQLRKKGKVGYREVVKNDTPLKDRAKGVGQEWTENLKCGTASLDIVSEEFLEIEDALKKANVDEKVWEIQSFKRGCWTTPIAARVYEGRIITPEKLVKNFYIRVTFRRRFIPKAEIAWNALSEKIPKFKYSTSAPKFKPGSGTALEIAPVDAHFAKLSWDAETLRGDYDLDIAVRDYQYVIEQNLAWGSVFKPEKIFFIVGNDLMHSENYSGTTPSGHNILDVDTRLPMLIEAAMEINIKAVYKCRSVSPVEVIWIPGNHDPTASLWLCMALKHHFKDDKHVTVDTSPAIRKARLWGNLLVGWTHGIVGRHGAWANELAQAFPELWGKSKYREWHHGHKHRKAEVKMSPVTTHGGVICRQLAALSPIDAWHFENLFTDAVPGGESYLWSKTKGIFSNFVAWTGDENTTVDNGS